MHHGSLESYKQSTEWSLDLIAASLLRENTSPEDEDESLLSRIQTFEILSLDFSAPGH